MSQKRIHRGDIVRIRHNESAQQFKENELVVVKKCFPLYAEFPTYFECANRTSFWRVMLEDITLFKRNPDWDDDDY